MTRSEGPTVLSLFAGIGGLELGLERAGMRVVGQVEIDPWCRDVLARHWPEVARHDDVRTTPEWWRSRTRPSVDLVAGGFPCQPFSAAGRRTGLVDERWGWPWMRDVVDAIRPTWVLAENVPRLLRDTSAFRTLLDDLSELGYVVEWSVVPACALGAPHTRERLFVLAYPAGIRLEAGRSAGTGPALLEPQRCRPQHRWGWPAQSRPVGVAYGVPRGVDRRRALGNAVVPAVTEHIGRVLLAGDCAAAA